MSNFYIAFAVYLNLIFVAAKLWDKVDWSWVWIMMPVAVLTIVGMVATVGQGASKKSSKGNIASNIAAIRELIDQSKSARAQKERSKH